MTGGRDQFRSSYGAFTARERELERNRARRDAREAEAGPDGAAAPPHAAALPATASPPERR